MGASSGERPCYELTAAAALCAAAAAWLSGKSMRASALAAAPVRMCLTPDHLINTHMTAPINVAALPAAAPVVPTRLPHPPRTRRHQLTESQCSGRTGVVCQAVTLLDDECMNVPARTMLQRWVALVSSCCPRQVRTCISRSQGCANATCHHLFLAL